MIPTTMERAVYHYQSRNAEEATLGFVGDTSKPGGSNQLWDAQQRELGPPLPSGCF